MYISYSEKLKNVMGDPFYFKRDNFFFQVIGQLFPVVIRNVYRPRNETERSPC